MPKISAARRANFAATAKPKTKRNAAEANIGSGPLRTKRVVLESPDNFAIEGFQTMPTTGAEAHAAFIQEGRLFCVEAKKTLTELKGTQQALRLAQGTCAALQAILHKERAAGGPGAPARGAYVDAATSTDDDAAEPYAALTSDHRVLMNMFCESQNEKDAAQNCVFELSHDKTALVEVVGDLSAQVAKLQKENAELKGVREMEDLFIDYDAGSHIKGAPIDR